MRLPLSFGRPLSGVISGNLDLGRAAVMEDLHDVSIVPLAYLFDNVLPSLPPSFDIEKVKRQLKADGITNKAGWKAFKKSPKCSGVHEPVAFQPLQDVFDGVTTTISRLHSEWVQKLKMK